MGAKPIPTSIGWTYVFDGINNTRTVTGTPREHRSMAERWAGNISLPKPETSVANERLFLKLVPTICHGIIQQIFALFECHSKH
jgi:hypothetical protein